MHRRPFSPEELRRICDVVENDDLMRPLIITAMCTAMRLGDCAKLQWDDVDLDEAFSFPLSQRTRRRDEGEKIMPRLLPPTAHPKTKNKDIKKLLADASKENAWETLQALKHLAE
jgi:integrase